MIDNSSNFPAIITFLDSCNSTFSDFEVSRTTFKYFVVLFSVIFENYFNLGNF